ncbi:hypothetical protein QYE76_041731 [Lolium multiflorum]|uniref:Integrase catalytic domain-containing protein n=1 Tax=Lolium multiflorum TaxID=4521 RepID=A0AAD8WWN4_LOLMU|nr:hypothetical protein QYE76_041731 [Lolium multiflorum]
MRQRRWIELIKDYDLSIHYHPGKANVVADALSREPCSLNARLKIEQPLLYQEFEEFGLELVSHGFLATLEVKPTLQDQIKEAQKGHESIEGIKRHMDKEEVAGFSIDEEGVLWYNGRLCVPTIPELKHLIMEEAHNTPYSIHPGGSKMYQDLKEIFWWHGMKRDIAFFIARCDVCQRVKAEHQRPAGLLQPLKVPVWKWAEVGMDFVTGLPRSSRGHDSIWVIVDRLTKVAHFIPVKTTFNGRRLADLYISRIVSLHGVPKRIVSDRGTQFTSRFWNQLHEALGTKLSFSTTYHPQTGGQTERVNQILEDMLRACVLAYGAKWEDCLPFAVFSYNNNYQASLQMAPFEALYGRKCRTPLNWSETGERQVFGPDVLREAEEQVQLIRDRLKAAQSRQKSYVDPKRREVTFSSGDFAYLRVTPLKGMQCFHVKGKLAPRYIGPFKVLGRRGEVSYQLELPAELSEFHDVFHVSQLRKCLQVPDKPEVFKNIDHRSIDLNQDLTYRERPSESWKRPPKAKGIAHPKTLARRRTLWKPSRASAQTPATGRRLDPPPPLLGTAQGASVPLPADASSPTSSRPHRDDASPRLPVGQNHRPTPPDALPLPIKGAPAPLPFLTPTPLASSHHHRTPEGAQGAAQGCHSPQARRHPWSPPEKKEVLQDTDRCLPFLSHLAPPCPSLQPPNPPLAVPGRPESAAASRPATGRRVQGETAGGREEGGEAVEPPRDKPATLPRHPAAAVDDPPIAGEFPAAARLFSLPNAAARSCPA